MQLKTIAAAAALSLLTLPAFAASDKADAAIAAAIAAADRAASIGGEWRDTRSIIKEAKAAAAEGDNATAIKLAKKAQEQGELGYAQADRQR